MGKYARSRVVEEAILEMEPGSSGIGRLCAEGDEDVRWFCFRRSGFGQRARWISMFGGELFRGKSEAASQLRRMN